MFLLLFIYRLLLGGAESEFTPTVYSTETTSQCGQYNTTQDEDLMTALQQIAQQTQSMKQLQGTSCQSIHSSNPSAPSGYYSITTANGSVAQVYCDMEGTNCGGEGGWTRVTYINMTQAGTTCPQGLEQMSFKDLLTVVGSHLDQVVCLQYYILPLATSRCVDEWLDIRKKLLMQFNHTMEAIVPT